MTVFGVAASVGRDVLLAAGAGAAVAASVAVLPTLHELPQVRYRWAPALGVALALGAIWARGLVLSLGGWIPVTPLASAEGSGLFLFAESVLPALVEEPLLRGVLPGVAAPFLGWWGAALVGVPVGAALHALPAVPLSASLAVELALQLGIVLVARWCGVGGAIVARCTCEALARRPVYAAGLMIDTLVLVVVFLGALALAWRGRSQTEPAG